MRGESRMKLEESKNLILIEINERSYFLSAETNDEANSWIESLCEVVHSADNQMKDNSIKI